MEIADIIKNVDVYGLDKSIQRAKYPMSVATDSLTSELTPGIQNLARCPKGEGHDNFLNGIVVQFDLTFTVKAWTEAERYHFLDFVSSQSTMHCILKFDLDKAYIEYVDPTIIKIMKEKVAHYNTTSDVLRIYRETSADDSIIQKTADKLKDLYLEILYSNPCGMRLTAGMTTNYRQLKTIYAQRKNHKLPEWRTFCKWIETLPEARLIVGEQPAEGKPFV